MILVARGLSTAVPGTQPELHRTGYTAADPPRRLTRASTVPQLASSEPV